MKRIGSFAVMFLLGLTTVFCQLSISSNNASYTIDFDSSLVGVNQGALAGVGFSTSPSDGQLDADAWATSGLSDGAKGFGVNNTGGDHARGTSNGGTASGGIYGFDLGSGNMGIGIQPIL